MKKLSLLSGIIALHTFVGIQAMEQERPQIWTLLDRFVAGSQIDWVMVFKFLDEMKGAIDVNEYKALNGKTLLDSAVSRGLLVVTKLLLEKYGANPNISDELGRTVLRWPILWTDIPMLQLLLQHGADPFLKGCETPPGAPRRMIDSFEYALMNDNPTIINILNEYKK